MKCVSRCFHCTVLYCDAGQVIKKCLKIVPETKKMNLSASFFVTPPRHDEPQSQEGGPEKKIKKK
jgi:hypothetical protein